MAAAKGINFTSKIFRQKRETGGVGMEREVEMEMEELLQWWLGDPPRFWHTCVCVGVSLYLCVCESTPDFLASIF